MSLGAYALPPFLICPPSRLRVPHAHPRAVSSLILFTVTAEERKISPLRSVAFIAFVITTVALCMAKLGDEKVSLDYEKTVRGVRPRRTSAHLFWTIPIV